MVKPTSTAHKAKKLARNISMGKGPKRKSPIAGMTLAMPYNAANNPKTVMAFCVTVAVGDFLGELFIKQVLLNAAS
jgi:hypothetical protein